MNKYNIPRNGVLNDIYNSREFWNLRYDMINGILVEYCNGCNQCEQGFNILFFLKN